MQVNIHGQVGEIVAGPFNQPLFGQLVGQLSPYDPRGRLTFTGWFQLFSNFCLMHGIEEEPVDQNCQHLLVESMRRILFIQFVGDRAYEEIRKASLPLLPNQRSIDFMVSVIKRAFEPQGMLEANRMKFSSLVQRDGQSAQSWCNTLQVAAETCEFGQAYSMNLKSRLISGVRDNNIREKFLNQATNLDYFGTKKLFLHLDSNRQQAQALARAANVFAVRQHQPSRSPSNGSRRLHSNRQRNQGQHASKVAPSSARPPQRASSQGQPTQGQGTPAQGDCWRCGRRHNPSTCPARFWTCCNCQQQGHTSRKCGRRPVHQADDCERSVT